MEDPTKTQNYEYDAWGRLKTAYTTDLSTDGTWKLAWDYDRFGNRRNQNVTGGVCSNPPPGVSCPGAPQLGISQTTNRITDAGFAYDASGNMTSDGIHTYAYDAANRTTTVDSTGATYSYLGPLRVKKVVGATTSVYVFSGSKVIAEYVNGALSKEYVYAGSRLLATATADGTTTYQHPDHLSIRAETDASGNLTRSFGHLPFGETWYETGTTNKWDFTSFERDSESAVDYAIFRNYSSRLGRFMQADLLAGSLRDPQSLNRYAYVRNYPAGMTDPLGLDEHCLPDVVPVEEGPADDSHMEDTLVWDCTWIDGGGGGGGGQPSVLGLVVAALQKKECRELFSANLDPFALLFEVLGGSDGFGPSYTGFFDFGDNSGNVAANTTPVFSRGNVPQPNGTTVYTNLGIVGAGIAINSNPAAPWQAGYNGRFGLSDDQNRAVTFIHELGHAADLLFGPDSTQIKNDVEDPTHAISHANSQLVADKCFN